MSHRSSLFLLWTAAWLLALAAGVAAETLEWRTGFTLHKVEPLEVGDTPGHVIGVGESRGMAFFAGGETAIAVNRFTFDYTGNNGPYRAYLLLTFEDGSTITARMEGSAAADSNGKVTLFKGSQSFLRGTGRFAGIRGGGSHTGKRFTPLDSGAGLYFDFTADYSLASR